MSVDCGLRTDWSARLLDRTTENAAFFFLFIHCSRATCIDHGEYGERCWVLRVRNRCFSQRPPSWLA